LSDNTHSMQVSW